MTTKRPTKAKVIRSADGVERVAQACDRCRSKKTKCDGKRPQCSQCAAVGFECKISDRLSRRAFPRGYTESLEERVRELEAENRKLKALIDLKDEQLGLLSKRDRGTLVNGENATNDVSLTSDMSRTSEANGANILALQNTQGTAGQNSVNNRPENVQAASGSFVKNEPETPSLFDSPQFSNKSLFEMSAANKLSSSNLSLLNQLNGPKIHTHEPHADGCNCGCVNFPHSVHERPTSIAASVKNEFDDRNLDDDDNVSLSSFEHPYASVTSKNGMSGINELRSESSFFDDNKKQFDFLRSNTVTNNNNLSNNGNNNSNSNNNYNDSINNDNNNNMNSFFNSFNVSLEQKEAPGAAAARTIASVNNDKTQIKNRIATLVAMAVPRTTEEILFIPSLINKVGQVHGYFSRASLLTAKSLALLKVSHEVKPNTTHRNLRSYDFNKLSKSDSESFFKSLKLPPRIDLDQLVTFFFQEWGSIIPIINQQEFLKHYISLTKSCENNFADCEMYKQEKFGGIVLLILALALFGKRRSNKHSKRRSGEQSNNVDKSITFVYSVYKDGPSMEQRLGNGLAKDDTNDISMSDSRDSSKLLEYYDSLIKEMINSTIIDTCSMQSLQILTLSLLYCLVVGEVQLAYVLRGRLVSMGHQLRLHRCPSAVLGNGGSLVSKIQQSERRISFWCIYILDVFASLQLGVPRLLKDYEIECALPFANDNDLDEKNNTNILVFNNYKLSLVGKVAGYTLAIMRYSKILGNILDSIFRRGGITTDSLNKSCIILENLLEDWRKELPMNLKFDLDINGLLKNNEYKSYSNQILVLIVLYYQAKMLIYLPVLATELYSSRGSASYITIHQASSIILLISNFVSKNRKYSLPIPLNACRMKARYGLLSAKSALEYARGGNLFQDLKSTLNDLLLDLKLETDMEILGCLTGLSMKTLEEAIQAILAPPNSSVVANNALNKTVIRKKSKSGSVSSGNSNNNNVPSNSSPLSGAVISNDTSSLDFGTNGLASQISAITNQINFGKTNSVQNTKINNADTTYMNNTYSNASTVSSANMQNSSSHTKNSPNEFDIESSILADFAADASLGLAQFLDIDTNFDMNRQNSNPGQNDQNAPNAPNAQNHQNAKNGQTVQNIQNVQNAQNAQNVQNVHNFPNVQNAQNAQGVHNGQAMMEAPSFENFHNIAVGGNENNNNNKNNNNNDVSFYVNNNDNNPVPTDSFADFSSSLFQWQKM